MLHRRCWFIVLVLILCLVGFSTKSQAQVNGCAPASAPRTVPHSAPAPAVLYLTTTSEHDQINPDGSAQVTEYGGAIVTGVGVVVTEWTIPKTDLQAQAGTPANCYRLPLPQFAQLLPANLYQITVAARNALGTGLARTSTDSFFLLAAPSAVPGVRLQSQ